MKNENLDLDVKPAGNKDLWLFLIIIDIILLCVFGFFLYKHFSARVFDAPTAPAAAVQQTETANVPEVSETEVITEEVTVEQVPAVQKTQEPVQVPAEVKKPEEKPVEVKQPEAKPEAAEKKESVIVKVNPKSKYRRVTFRWFGEGKKVSVVSGFTMAKPQPLKKRGDYWETTLSIAPGTYKFLYVVDGQNRLDPYSEEKDGRSLLVVK